MRSDSANKKMTVETQKRLLGGESTFKKVFILLTIHYNKKQQPKNDEKNFKLLAIINSRPNDVLYTLKIHSKEAQTELNISNFIEDRKALITTQEKAKIKNQRKPSKKCQERLYPSTKSTLQTVSLFDRLLPLYLNEKETEVNDVMLYKYWQEMPQHLKEKHRMSYSNPVQVKLLLEQSYSEKSTEFCETLENLYKNQNPDHKNYKRADIMVNFWTNYDGKDLKTQDGVFKDAREVIRVVEKFYQDKIKVLCKLFMDRYGFEVDDCKDKEGKVIMTKQMRLFKFWKKELGNENDNFQQTSPTKSKGYRTPSKQQSPNKSQLQKSMISSTSSQRQNNANTKKLRKLDFECDENIIYLIDEYFKQQEFQKNLMVYIYKNIKF